MRRVGPSANASGISHRKVFGRLDCTTGHIERVRGKLKGGRGVASGHEGVGGEIGLKGSRRARELLTSVGICRLAAVSRGQIGRSSSSVSVGPLEVSSPLFCA